MRRFSKISVFIGDSKTRPEVRRKIILDNLKAEYSAGGGGENSSKASFSFGFNEKMVDILKFPYQYENEAVGKNFKFDIKVRNGFEDWEGREDFGKSDLEEMNYRRKFLFFF